jgi:2-polyprenyl-3-methyl-5-hydroxy-6-metoxy-1,4-benzoquinol methylase
MSASYYREPRPDVRDMLEPAGRRILDVGCGEGALGAALKQAGAERVVGIERHSAAAEVARNQLDEVLEGDVAQLAGELTQQSFDYLIFADVLEHLTEPERVLARLLPLLEPDGRVVVSVPNMRFYLVLARLVFDRWSYADSGVRDRTHLRIFTRRSLERMLTDHGLVIERLRRNYRLLDDQSQIGRAGALATRFVQRVLGPLLFRDLMAYQYVAVARRR